jgi:hypothetical protein
VGIGWRARTKRPGTRDIWGWRNFVVLHRMVFRSAPDASLRCHPQTIGHPYRNRSMRIAAIGVGLPEFRAKQEGVSRPGTRASGPLTRTCDVGFFPPEAPMAPPSEKGSNDRSAYGVRPFKLPKPIGARESARPDRTQQSGQSAAEIAPPISQYMSPNPIICSTSLSRREPFASIKLSSRQDGRCAAYRTNARNRSCDQ